MRGLLSITLLGLVLLLGFQYLYKPHQPAAPAPPAPTQSQSQPQTGPQDTGQSATPGQPAQPRLTTAAAPAHPATPAVTASVVTETTIENENYRIVLTNHGAQAKHWILLGKQYKDHPDPGGQQLDLVNPRTAGFGLPLSLFTYEKDLTEQLNSALYQVSISGEASETGVLKAPCSVTFHYALNGLDVVKTFRFDASYVVTAEVQVRRSGAPVRALLAWPSGLGDQTEAMQFAYGKFAWSVNGKDDSSAAMPPWISPTSSPARWIFTLPWPSCRTRRPPPRWSRCTTPSNCPAIRASPTAKRSPWMW
jgi:YidC/Oxa1 family membrane protein insertase